MNEQLELISVARVVVVEAEPELIPASYWARSLRPAYRGASQEELDALLEECRAEERGMALSEKVKE